MNAVDTNVLIYARDPRDPVKQQRAVQLTTGLSDGALLWQPILERGESSPPLEFN